MYNLFCFFKYIYCYQPVACNHLKHSRTFPLKSHNEVLRCCPHLISKYKNNNCIIIYDKLNIYESPNLQNHDFLINRIYESFHFLSISMMYSITCCNSRLMSKSVLFDIGLYSKSIHIFRAVI